MLPCNAGSRNEAQWDVMLFLHLTDLFALFFLSRPIFLSNLSHPHLFFPPPVLLLSLPPFTENLILMQQTVHTVTGLFQIAVTDPLFMEQLDHLRSQVTALTTPLSHIYHSS